MKSALRNFASVVLVSIGVAASSARGDEAVPPASPHQPLAVSNRCDSWPKILVHQAATRASLAALEARLAAGEAQPQRDAAQAAEAGDYRLYWNSFLGGPRPMALTCRPVGEAYTRLNRGTLTHSDVVGDCERRGPDACQSDARLERYGAAYNLAMAAHRAFPHDDVCRAQAPGDRSAGPTELSALGRDAPPAPMSHPPRSLHQAARFGDVAALQAMLKAKTSAVDATDAFGVTPLAWAVVSNQSTAIAALVKAGADPIGGDCRDTFGHRSPLRLALLYGRSEQAKTLLAAAPAAGLTPWPRTLIEAAVEGDQAALVQRMLREPHEFVDPRTLLIYAGRGGADRTLKVLLEQGPDYAQARLKQGILLGDVRMVSKALRLGAQAKVLGQDPRTSPLGEAVQVRKPGMDKIVHLLLEAGAEPDSPASLTPGAYPTGSKPGTALLALIATSWTSLSSLMGPEESALVAADVRSLDLLLNAGASVSAKDEDGRTLAQIIQARALRGQVLPAELQASLRRAGVQVAVPPSAPR